MIGRTEGRTGSRDGTVLGTWADREPFRSALQITARVLVGGIFLLAGITKVGSPGAFADAVRAYHLLPGTLVLPFAYILPWLELLVAVYLLIGFMTRLAAAGRIRRAAYARSRRLGASVTKTQ